MPSKRTPELDARPGRISRYGHLVLQLKGGSSTQTVYLDVVGTGANRVYLGAYSHKSGSYAGSADGKRLLQWLEAAAKRVRMDVERATRRRVEGKQMRGKR